MAAAHYELGNLVAIIDHNTLQITGRTRDVCSNEPLDEKFRAFGWDVQQVDGHSIAELTSVFSRRENAMRPLCVIANRRDINFRPSIESMKLSGISPPNAGSG